MKTVDRLTGKELHECSRYPAAICMVLLVTALTIGSCGGAENRVVGEDSKGSVVSSAVGVPSSLFDNPDGTVQVATAGLVTDLAAVRLEYTGPGARRATAAGYRTADGEWGDLPVPDVFGSYDLAIAGDTVVLGGLECISERCDRFAPRFLALDAERLGWVEIDSDIEPLDAAPDSEASAAIAYRRPMDHAVFTLGSRDYAVSVTGGVVDLSYPEPTSPDETGFYCLTDDVEILVHGTAGSVEEPVALTGQVEVRHLDRLAEGFVPVASAPEITVDNLSSVCGYREMTLHKGPTSHTFDLDSNEWVSAPSNYMEVNNGNTIAEASDAQLALPDGTVYEDNKMRAPDGTWSLIPSGLYLVLATQGVVYALGDDGVSTFQGVDE